MVSSARVLEVSCVASQQTTKEAYLLQRSKHKANQKKIQVSAEIIDNHQSTGPSENLPTYRDKLLNLFGEDVHEKLTRSIVEESLSAQNNAPKIVDAGVEIPLSDEEWDQWSTP